MKGIRAGLWLLFIFGVLAFGSVEVWAQSSIEIGAAVLLVAWAVILCFDSEVKIYANPLFVPILGFSRCRRGAACVSCYGISVPYTPRITQALRPISSFSF